MTDFTFNLTFLHFTTEVWVGTMTAENYVSSNKNYHTFATLDSILLILVFSLILFQKPEAFMPFTYKHKYDSTYSYKHDTKK